MLIARWQIDARFGQKQTLIDATKRWSLEIAPEVGLLVAVELSLEHR